MKKTFLLYFVTILFLPIFTNAAVYVHGYYRSNGTYVQPHYRSNPDGNPYNNWSYPGNTNPYTGETATGNPDTYLNNYYNKSSGGSYSPSYGSYSPSYPTTPTCPINSYYDGVSSCKCNYGYVVSGGSCVSADIQCHQQIGYASSYDSLSGNCKCDSGYALDSSGQCKSVSLICSDQLGLMSQYSSLTKKCECMSGYEYNGSSCVYKTTNYSDYSAYSASAYSASVKNCPLNSHISSSDSTKCQCDSGYQPNSTKTGCVLISTNTNDQACSNAYANSKWDGTKTSSGLLNCGCQSGYSWNGMKTACVTTTYAPPIFTTPQVSNTETIAKDYYLTNRTCIGLSGNQYESCISYAWNH